MPTDDPVTFALAAAAGAALSVMHGNTIERLQDAVRAGGGGNRNLAAGNLMAVQEALRASLAMIDGALAMHALPDR